MLYTFSGNCRCLLYTQKNTIPFLYFFFQVLSCLFLLFTSQEHLYQKTPSREHTSFLNILLDSYAFITATFKSQFSGVGLIIMSVAGFAAYMKHINASAKLAFLTNKPLGKSKINT